MANLQHHPVTWHAPAPLWREMLQNGAPPAFHRPELLRFASDDFMSDLEGVLEADPRALAGHIVRPETWRNGSTFASIPVPANGEAVKLFQPSHQRFYLVTGSLVCQTRGLPDRRVDTGNDETVSFVLRRLVTEVGAVREYGWFGDAGWKRMPDAARVDISTAWATPLREERHPLFSMPFPLNGHPRKLLAGFIPVAGRERFEAAPRENVPALPPGGGGDELADPRFVVYTARFKDALVNLRDFLGMGCIAENEREDAGREILAFMLLDLMELLETHANPVFQAVLSNASSLPNTHQNALLQAFRTENIIETTRWRTALSNIWTRREALREGETDAAIAAIPWLRDASIGNLRNVDAGSPIRTAIENFLRATPAPGPGTVPDAPVPVDASGDATYVIRCVYERPKCEPYLRDPIVSEPTRPFRMASFFDADAPARPLRITFPVDTSISGLRKFPKNVSILMSDKLREQFRRVQGITMSQIENGELNSKTGFDLGMICSLSIPIITICALILLMIIVQLLNIVFFWLPFFKVCIPCNLRR